MTSVVLAMVIILFVSQDASVLAVRSNRGMDGCRHANICAQRETEAFKDAYSPCPCVNRESGGESDCCHLGSGGVVLQHLQR